MSLRGGGGATGPRNGTPDAHGDHRHHGATTTAAAFDRLDALMSRQPPNAKIPQPPPLNVDETPVDPDAPAPSGLDHGADQPAELAESPF